MSKAKTKTGATWKKQNQTLHLFLFYSIQAISLSVGATHTQEGLSSSVNSFSHTHNHARPISWAFLTQVDTRVNYHRAGVTEVENIH